MSRAKQTFQYSATPQSNKTPSQGVFDTDYEIPIRAVVPAVESSDAFGRLRVSFPYTLFDFKSLIDNGTPLWWDEQEVSGGGTSTAHSTDRASVIMTVGAATAGKRVRQTKQWFGYQPGKSQLIICTGVIGAATAGVTRSIGYFNDRDGLFFRSGQSAISVVERSYVTGSAVDTAVVQSKWNLDTLDGNGASGVELDFTKTQIFLADFEWLGVGSVRYGFVVDGEIIYCHQSNHANIGTAVYMSNPNLPIRYEIEADGSNVEASIECICATVASEGSVEPSGLIRSGNLGVAAADEIQAADAGNKYAVVAIKLDAGSQAAQVRPIDFSLITTAGSGQFLWEAILNPTYAANGVTYSSVPGSPVLFGKGLPAGTTCINGYVLASGYVTDQLESVSASVASELTGYHLGCNIAGVSDEIVIVVNPVTANQDVLGSLSWLEVV